MKDLGVKACQAMTRLLMNETAFRYTLELDKDFILYFLISKPLFSRNVRTNSSNPQFPMILDSFINFFEVDIHLVNQVIHATEEIGLMSENQFALKSIRRDYLLKDIQLKFDEQLKKSIISHKRDALNLLEVVMNKYVSIGEYISGNLSRF